MEVVEVVVLGGEGGGIINDSRFLSAPFTYPGSQKLIKKEVTAKRRIHNDSE